MKMLKGLKPSFLQETVEAQLKIDLFENGNENKLLFKEEVCKQIAKKQIKTSNLCTMHNIYEIGYTGVVYKVHVLYTRNNLTCDHNKIFLFGYLDAHSSYPIIVTNIDLSEKQKEKIDFFKKHGHFGILGLRTNTLLAITNILNNKF